MFFIYNPGLFFQAVGRGFDPRLPLHLCQSIYRIHLVRHEVRVHLLSENRECPCSKIRENVPFGELLRRGPRGSFPDPRF